MEKWTLERYRELVRSSREQIKSDYPDAEDNVLSDFAQCNIDSEPGLADFIRSHFGAEDPTAYHADDLNG